MNREKENPFQKLGHPPQEVPKELRQKVMDDINAVKLLMDLTDLFSMNYASSIESMFKTNKRPNRKDKNDENNSNNNDSNI